ncbi:riboflavin kinase isoform X1 [Mobula hypostoma]|uniref:riboflavin kinase isoform X1 n=1 Tax=Mobula hypostoma TaxID=723540 RepID=UPI002FC2DEDF
MKSLPYFCRGEVVRGFGRGSKELGIPTANFPDAVVEHLPGDITTGIYYGWACVGHGDVHKMVMSIGWNPYYKNKKKSMETHIIHTFKEDFYGEILSIAIVGYIRPEKSFDSLDNQGERIEEKDLKNSTVKPSGPDSLITAIYSDISEAKEKLDLPEYQSMKDDNFFRSIQNDMMNGH